MASPNYTAEVLVESLHKDTAMYLTEVLGELHAGVSHRDSGPEVSGSEPRLYVKRGLFKEKHTWNKVMH